MTGLVPGILAGILITLALQTLALLLWDIRDANRRARRPSRHRPAPERVRLFIGPPGGTE